MALIFRPISIITQIVSWFKFTLALTCIFYVYLYDWSQASASLHHWKFHDNFFFCFFLERRHCEVAPCQNSHYSAIFLQVFSRIMLQANNIQFETIFTLNKARRVSWMNVKNHNYNNNLSQFSNRLGLYRYSRKKTKLHQSLSNFVGWFIPLTKVWKWRFFWKFQGISFVMCIEFLKIRKKSSKLFFCERIHFLMKFGNEWCDLASLCIR